jgi:uncharacterized LabA/DUF88 family protein
VTLDPAFQGGRTPAAGPKKGDLAASDRPNRLAHETYPPGFPGPAHVSYPSLEILSNGVGTVGYAVVPAGSDLGRPKRRRGAQAAGRRKVRWPALVVRKGEPMDRDRRDTVLLIDVDNTYISLQRNRSRALDLAELIELAGGRDRLLDVVAYADFGQLPPSLLQHIRHSAVRCFHVPSRAADGRALKDAVDRELAADILDTTLSNNAVHRLVVGTGDGDFVPALMRVRRHQKEIHVVGVEGSVARRLLEFVGEGNISYLQGGRSLRAA